RRLPVRRRVPGRLEAGRPAPPGRNRADRRRRPPPRPGRIGMSAQAVVAVVGRPNVGKSTLLNRIVGRREAIVEEKPGVTRDRKEVEAEWQGREFIAVDTGGWLPSRDSLDAKVSEQAEKAMRDADVVVFVVDATVGVIEEDAQVANVLRKLGRRVIVVANKVDDSNREAAIWDFLEFGLGEPSAI